MNLTPTEARAIAKEAYIYAFPIVDNMRVQYAYFTDKNNPDYKAPYNTLFNIPRVFTPDDKAIQGSMPFHVGRDALPDDRRGAERVIGKVLQA